MSTNKAVATTEDNYQVVTLDLSGLNSYFRPADNLLELSVPCINAPMFDKEWEKEVKAQLGERQGDMLMDELAETANRRMFAEMLAKRIKM